MNPQMMPLALVALSIAGAFADWKYKKAGGKRPSRRERLLFGMICLIVAGAIILTEYTGMDPYGILGYVTLPLAIALFGAWELGRWRTRRKHPLQTLETNPPL